ncbi:2-amino-4-hydroxy-6-hydroxymethyldihydropteridine diphosphokinase [Lyngbya confervoides]|uniref:2-amino-4-hydroxy-6-hydroxymethyldihydropteridine diphosphokinase n=1 Tax=Lyngbya confervoides BDU141951 TaxID=1574623 RepID=A0ABD4T3M2_9CYAN|nr:2-amino-4-hydroxy-6-hydroxymethyldihydropteridine diphosphokinase [Lyngbya confervoides]MCM1983342.1 2-amino-4-hydroxy-6-hydroxymethyldihydropteridine diphosphokinase [Lyngbya confervoides BDU141951]
MQPHSPTPPGLIAAVGLGSNLGDSLNILQGAIATLNNHAHLWVLAQSHWYRTPALGPPQPDYINGCILLRCCCPALNLLSILHQVEHHYGRVRQQHWGPRTLDLDLLFFGHQIIQTPQISVPHPHLQDRAFVLQPLLDIYPDFQHPVLKQTVRALAHAVSLDGIERISTQSTVPGFEAPPPKSP